MYILKGFASHAALTNNTPGIVAKIGELSTKALTYSREKGTFTHADKPNLTLTSFISANDNTIIQVPTLFEDHVLDVINYLYTKILNSNGMLSADLLLEAVSVDYANVITDFSCGNMVTDNQLMAPEYVSWKCLLNGADSNMIKIWFCNESFLNQYDDYEIVVVPPVAHLNDFFKAGYDVVEMVNAITPADSMLLVQTAKGVSPETIISVQTYTYQDPMSSARKVDVSWYILVYGAAGNNLDAINTAVADFVLKNSTHTRDEWKAIFPDIFRRTEFILFPLWDQYAIPNRTIESGIYSPIVNFKRIMDLVKPYLPNYPANHVDANISVLSHPYKSLQVAVVAGPENKNNWFNIRDLYKDYIDVSSTSIDYNRMSKATRDWADAIYELILVAETMTMFTTMPVGMYRIQRDGVVFAAKSFNGVNFMVVSKGNMSTAITGE